MSWLIDFAADKIMEIPESFVYFVFSPCRAGMKDPAKPKKDVFGLQK